MSIQGGTPPNDTTILNNLIALKPEERIVICTSGNKSFLSVTVFRFLQKLLYIFWKPKQARAEGVGAELSTYMHRIQAQEQDPQLQYLGFVARDHLVGVLSKKVSSSLTSDGVDADKVMNLAKRFETGTDTLPADPQKAFTLYQLVAKSGRPEVHCALAQCYEKGIGVQPDPKKALEQYLLAIQTPGRDQAHFNLAQ